MDFFVERLSSFLSHFQKQARKYFILFFFLFFLLKKYITDTTSFHTRSKFLKQLDTTWLQLLNVLGKVLTSALMLLPHEMYVYSFFSLAYFLTGVIFFCRVPGNVKVFSFHTITAVQLAFPSPSSSGSFIVILGFPYLSTIYFLTGHTHSLFSLVWTILPTLVTQSFRFFFPLDIQNYRYTRTFVVTLFVVLHR